jgi:hypothetical protein
VESTDITGFFDSAGADYAAGGLGVLRVMVAASLFVGVNSVYFAIKRVHDEFRGMGLSSVSGFLDAGAVVVDARGVFEWEGAKGMGFLL